MQHSPIHCPGTNTNYKGQTNLSKTVLSLSVIRYKFGNYFVAKITKTNGLKMIKLPGLISLLYQANENPINTAYELTSVEALLEKMDYLIPHCCMLCQLGKPRHNPRPH